MKINTAKTTLSLALILVCSLAFAQNKEERDLSEFSGISLGIHADLYLTQGSPQKVVIEADDSNLPDIQTVVRDGVLRIKTNKCWSNFKNVKIWITITNVQSLSVSGSGELIAETAISSQELEMKVSGSGNIMLMSLKVEKAKASISGSGNMQLGGTAGEISIGISGSGDLKAAKLKAVEAGVRISGSGSCEVDATDKLDASLSGSGKVTYFSNPQVDARVSGSGKVRKGQK